MTTTKSAKKISTSSIYCSQLKHTLEKLESQNSVTNYVLAYTFLVLTIETYLSGLFPLLLRWLSGRGRHIEIISHAKRDRDTLSLDNKDLLEDWYDKVAYKPLLKADKKEWIKGQIPKFFEKIGYPLSEKENDYLYNNYYSLLYEIRNTLFHRDELVSGDFGPDSFMDKFFNLDELNNTIELAQKLIVSVHKMIDKFITEMDFEKKPSNFKKTLKEVYEDHKRSVYYLLNYKT